MLTSPYKIVVVPQINAEPSDEQMTWMNRRLRMLGASAVNMGLSGDCVHVFVYPMKRGMQELPHWAAHWRRPEHSVINLLRQVHAYNTHDTLADAMARTVMHECVACDADEIWCLNAAGQGQMSTSPAARVWRYAQTNAVTVASRFKLVPSWVISDAPERPVKKEKSNAKGNVSRSLAPARKAGKGSAAKSGRSRDSRREAGADKPIPWFDS